MVFAEKSKGTSLTFLIAAFLMLYDIWPTLKQHRAFIRNTLLIKNEGVNGGFA